MASGDRAYKTGKGGSRRCLPENDTGLLLLGNSTNEILISNTLLYRTTLTLNHETGQIRVLKE